MKRYFTKTFAMFLFAFCMIIALAFAVAILIGPAVSPVDNIAQPR
jgi:hypothetical protein